MTPSADPSLARLAAANAAARSRFPGDAGGRQPVHTVYGGAHLFRADTAPQLGEPGAARARRVRARRGHVRRGDRAARARWPTPSTRACARSSSASRSRTSASTSRTATATAPTPRRTATPSPPRSEVAAGVRGGHAAAVHRHPHQAAAPTSCAPRSLRTLDVFLDRRCVEATRRPPARATSSSRCRRSRTPQPGRRARRRRSTRSSSASASPPGALPHRAHGRDAAERSSTADGAVAAARARRRRRAAAAPARTSAPTTTPRRSTSPPRTSTWRHPACDFAKHVMQVALAGTGVCALRRRDQHHAGRRTAPRGRAGADGRAGATRTARVVHRAWRSTTTHVRHSLVHGFYQGWDLHPAQLPTRYAAVYAFFLEGLDAGVRAAARTSSTRPAQATLVGDVFDDAATGQGLLNYFLRAHQLRRDHRGRGGARTGLTLEELRGRSFLRILERRR